MKKRTDLVLAYLVSGSTVFVSVTDLASGESTLDTFLPNGNRNVIHSHLSDVIYPIYVHRDEIESLG